MDAINLRLKQLDDIETGLYLERERAIQRRRREDLELQSKRQQEDQDYLQQLSSRDDEEDMLRQDRRVLARSALPNYVAADYKGQVSGSCNTPTARSKTKMKRPIGDGDDSAQKRKKALGLPTAHDSQGKALFTRPSDGKLVYLRCYVEGCERTTFDSAQALRRHVSQANYRHKMKGTFSSNRHAIEVCGEVAPGQEGILSRAQAQAVGNAPTGNMASSTTLAASTSLSNTYDHKGRPSSGFLSDSLVGSDNGLGSSPLGSTVRDLGRVYRASFVTRNSRSHVEKTRTDRADELYDGLSSSDPEEGDEAQSKSSIPADKIDRHVAAKDNAGQYKFPLGAEKSDSICATEEHQATANTTTDATNITVKVEGATTPPFFVYQSPEYPIPISLAATDRAFRVPYPGTKTNTKMQKGDISATQTQKRAASSPPSTPPPLGKRPLGTDEPSTI